MTILSWWANIIVWCGSLQLMVTIVPSPQKYSPTEPQKYKPLVSSYRKKELIKMGAEPAGVIVK